MGERVRPGLRTLLDQGKIRRFKSSPEMIAKELDVATRDLEAAKASLATGDHKWATVQSYYSMFHAARALLYRMGYRERSHRGLLAALRELYESKIIGKMLEDFSEAMTLREDADYGLISSDDSAAAVLEHAQEFLEEAARILAAPREWFERPRRRKLRISRSNGRFLAKKSRNHR